MRHMQAPRKIDVEPKIIRRLEIRKFYIYNRPNDIIRRFNAARNQDLGNTSQAHENSFRFDSAPS